MFDVVWFYKCLCHDLYISTLTNNILKYVFFTLSSATNLCFSLSAVSLEGMGEGRVGRVLAHAN